MEEKQRKTKETQLKASRAYEARNDRINVVFPAGTRDRIKALGVDSVGGFIKEAVSEKLDSLEKYIK